ERIVSEQLDKLEITLSEEDRQLLINLFEKMRELDIDFDQVKDQLEDISSKVKNKLEDLMEDEGFWQKVENFFKKIIEALRNFIIGILGDERELQINERICACGYEKGLSHDWALLLMINGSFTINDIVML